MELVVARRSIRGLQELPDFKELKWVCRLIHLDADGDFMSMQYMLRYKNVSYSIEIPQIDDCDDFEKYLDRKFKAAGVKPKFAKGTVQGYPIENKILTEENYEEQKGFSKGFEGTVQSLGTD